MKRRVLLKALAGAPAAAAVQVTTNQTSDLTATRDKGLPTGPPLVPPGINETPNTPVVVADEVAATVSTTFNPGQFAALERLGEIIVPAWEGRPGATGAGAAEFLDFLIGCSPKDRVDLYCKGLDALNGQSVQRFGAPFAAISIDQAQALLSPLRQSPGPEAVKPDLLKTFLEAAKGDLLRATFNSRPYIDALSQTRRPRNASRFYWYPIN
jgi:Gluconate 2-dehydrogenase subunit 3